MAGMQGGGGSQQQPSSAGPTSAGRYGVTNTVPLSLVGMLDPTGIMSLMNIGARANNINKIQGVQSSLGMPETSLVNALNPFSRVASGSATASLGDFKGTPVSFGGITEGLFGGNLRTSFTPQEAIARQNSGNARKASQAGQTVRV